MVQEAFEPSVSAPQGLGPLRRFRGKLDSYEALDRTATGDNGATRTYKVIQFKMVEVEVLEATEPYPFPVATIQIGYAPPDTSFGGTKWEAFSSSFRKLMPEDPKLSNLVGKTQEWAMLPGKLRRQIDNPDYHPDDPGSKRQVWAEVEDLCWQIVDIEGISKPEDLFPLIIELADGKTEAEFNQAMLTHPKITSRTDIVGQITDRTLLPALLTTNQLVRDAEGVLHKVG